MLKKEYENIIRILKKEIIAYYGKRLVSIVIFGSVARGTYRPDSDIDLLLIIQDLPKGLIKRVDEFIKHIENVLENRIKKLLRKGIYIEISPVIKTPEETLRGSPLFIDMIEDATILYDRNGFFKKVLKALRKHMELSDAKRVWKANAWYWDLKPDYKPGDVIEL